MFRCEAVELIELTLPRDLVKASFETVVPRIQLLIDEQEEELKTLKLRDKLTVRPNLSDVHIWTRTNTTRVFFLWAV